MEYEEIVKDVIRHKNAAETYGFVQITGKQMSIWLDLIHHLQEDNKGLKERGEIVINSVYHLEVDK